MLSLTDVAILLPQRDQLSDGLDQVAQTIEALEQQARFVADLPLLGRSMAQLLSPADILRNRIVNPIASALAGGTSAGVVTALKNLGGTFGDLSVEVDASRIIGGQGAGSLGDEIRFTLPLTASRTISLPLDFTDAGGKLPLAAASPQTISLTATLEAEITFGIELSGQFSDEEAFFIQFDKLEMSISVDSSLPALNFSLGFLNINSPGATLLYEAQLDVLFANPDFEGVGLNDHKISRGELAGTSLENLIHLVPTLANVDASIPLQATMPGLNLNPASRLQISGNPFADAGLDYTLPEVGDFAELANFLRGSPGGVGQVFSSLGSWLTRLSESAPMNLDLPLADVGRMSDLVDLGAI